MLLLSLTDLFKPATRDEVVESMLGTGATLELPTTSWRVGGVTRIVLKVIGQKIADLTQIMTLIAMGGLLDYATQGWLTLLARSVYNVLRILSSAAAGTLTLTNTGISSQTFGVGEVHFANEVTGATYHNAEPINVAASGTQTIAIIADIPGAASSAGAGEITQMVSVIAGVTCSNAAAVVGLDEETDTDLRQRCRDKLAALSPNGPQDAYAFIAKSSTRADGSSIGITRVKTLGDSNVGQVTVYVATATGGVTGSSGDVTTDLGAVNYAIQTQTVPTGITAEVLSANADPLAYTITVYLSRLNTRTAAEVKQAVVDKLAAYFPTVPIGGFDIGSGGRVFVAAIVGQVFQTDPNIVDVAIVQSDAILSASDVATSSTVASDVTVVQLTT